MTTTLQTDLILRLKDKVKHILERHQGRHDAITRRELRSILELGAKEDRKLRLLISELRREGFPVMFATQPPAGYYMPATLTELREGMDNLRSYIIDECIVLRGFKVLGNRYLARECQGKLL